ncbi:hypothetical protein [Gloeomargarita lithophora]|uniref:hypothetical protein n=1 Tax=Gloeomargarita lithophora TaxID=1188228 RepID=UPI0012FDC8F3|nr:hypothetical protein [Gloeomargarita lithophora]
MYIGVNGGDRDADITHGRSLFIEWDDCPKPEQWERLRDLEGRGFPAPTFTIESRRSVHTYWVLPEPLPVETWRALQAELLRLTGADPTIKNPSRLMRLAGSLHVMQGLEPVGCPLQLGTGRPVTPGELKSGLRQLAPPPPPNDPPQIIDNSPPGNPIDLSIFLAKNHQDLINTGAKTGSRNGRGYALACDLIGVDSWLKNLRFSPSPSAYELFTTYCQHCPSGDGWDSAEWDKIWQSAANSMPKPCCSDSVLTARLKRIMGDNDEPEGEKTSKKSVAKLLIGIAQNECDLWQSDTGEGWADILIEGIRHSHPLRSGRFRKWLAGRLWADHELPSNSEAMQSCLTVLESFTEFGGLPKRKVFLRVGELEGYIYLDVANEQNQLIEVSPAGWRVIESTDCPVRFERCDTQEPLPLPVAGGDLSKLWEIIPVATGYREMVLAWEAFTLIPAGAKPVLTLHGAKGAGKSTTAKLLKRLIDPGKADLLNRVGDGQTIATNARRRLILAYDNLSHLTASEQDAMCRVSTGGSFTARKLYTDLDDIFYEFTRPQILTSVDCIPTRSDLLDRCLLVQVERIDESLRLPEGELWRKLNELAPELLGGLLDLVAAGLRNLSTVNERLPRMADFAKFGIAALGQEFITAYRDNIATAQNVAIESNPVASAICELVAGATFEGTATQLLTKLQALSDCPKIAKLTSRALGRMLSSKAFVQDLFAAGVSVDSYRKAGGKERGWIISNNPPPENPQPPPGDKPPPPNDPPPPVTFTTEKSSLVSFEESKGETFFNGDVTADKHQKIMSQMSQTSQARQGADSSCDIIQTGKTDNVTTQPDNVTTPQGAEPDNVTSPDNVTKTSQLEPRHSAGCDISDICDIIQTPLSGVSPPELKKVTPFDFPNETKQQKSVANVTPFMVDFVPGDLVVYRGDVPEIKALWPEPVRVICITGGVMLTLPLAGGKTDTVGIWGWELI